MNQVLLVGYYGMLNTGDDALLAASSWGCGRLFGLGSQCATAPGIPRFPGWETVRPAFRSRQRFRGEVRLRSFVEAVRSSAIVFGGGSVFQDAADIERRQWLVRLAGRGPHRAVGVSLGPFRNTEAERSCARLLSRLDFVGVRDSASLELAQSLLPRNRIRLTFDLAPLLTSLAPLGAPSHSPSRRVGFALCDYERHSAGDVRRDDERRRRLRALAATLDPGLVDEVVFIDFNGHPELGDRAIHEDVARSVPAGIKVRHLPYTPDPLAVLDAVRSLGALVAVRLHAAVFAFISGTPSVVVAYHPKCRGWAEQVGVPSAMVHDGVEFDPVVAGRQLHAALRGDVEAPSLSASEAHRRALLNFEP